jgi:magnesium transporter
VTVADEIVAPASGERVAELVVRSVPSADASERVGDVRAALLRGSFEQATDVVVLENDRVAGLVPVERVLAAGPGTRLGELSGDELPVVAEDVDREHAAALAAHLGSRTVGVVDADGRLLGLVPPETLIRTLFEEHEEDLARLGGSLKRSFEAARASVEAVPQRLWHRLPWLAIGLAGAMLSAAIVGSFEEELRDEVLLAFFVPAVVYMADAVGTQTETVIIRGMSLGIPIRSVAARELLTGLIIGCLIAGSFFLFALAVWQNVDIAAIVSLSLLVSTSLATAVAMLLPYGLARLGRDPAFGSGPLATVIQDLLSIAAYFTIAVAIL